MYNVSISDSSENVSLSQNCEISGKIIAQENIRKLYSSMLNVKLMVKYFGPGKL